MIQENVVRSISQIEIRLPSYQRCIKNTHCANQYAIGVTSGQHHGLLGAIDTLQMQQLEYFGLLKSSEIRNTRILA